MKPDRIMRLLALTATVLLALVVTTLVVSFLASPLAALGVLVVAAAAFLVWRVLSKRVRKGTVIEIDLDQGVVEKPPATPLERMLHRDAVVLRDVTDALDRAREDDRVTGVVARLGNGRLGLAQAQDIAAAVQRFRSAGKRTVAYSDSFGETGNATVDYYLASAFEEIHLLPGAMVSIQGLVARTPFLGGFFDRLGVVPDFDHRREYKSAKYLFTETDFTESHEESITALLESQMTQIIEGVAEQRGLDHDQVRALVDDAPLTAAQALEAGLVDGLSYRDQAYESAGVNHAKPMFAARYLKKAGRPHRKGERIGMVFGTGTIVRGSSGLDPLERGTSFGADDVAQALREARDDDKVRAIVFRVDSRGGSAVGSEVVRREVVRAVESGKPVVVSMGDVAASGGYWVSTHASRIVAQPGTVTGSIGVVAGKLARRDAWERIGINWRERHLGRNATFSVPDEPYTDSERERLGATLDAIYDDFKDRVAEGRSLEAAEVEEIAKGRVWTGAQAAERGLVDELGGLDRAVELAGELAGIPEDRPRRVTVYPKTRPIPVPERKEGSDPIGEIGEVMLTALESLIGHRGAPTFQVITPWWR